MHQFRTDAPDFETDASTDGDGNYDVTVTINDGVQDGATITYVVTVTDTNDESPVFTSSDTINVAEGATAVVTLTSTDGDAADSGGPTYAIDTNDNNLFAITGSVVTLSVAADFETPGCGSTSNTCTIVVSATDGNSQVTQQTITVTITDVNDQTPTYTAGDTTPSVAEGATAVDSAVAITDSDSGDANVCTLAGDDAALFTCTLTDQTAYSLAFTDAPDFETDASTDGDGNYDVTVTINDGAQNGATITYVVTVTDTNDETPTYTAGDTTPSVAEGSNCSRLSSCNYRY